jgi:hypothetical protein
VFPAGRFIIAIALVGILVPISVSQAATAGEKESLRGLPGIVLKPMAFVSTPTNVHEELPLSDLTREIEKEFRQSGILLDERFSEGLKERPYLEIQGAVTQIAANYYAYTIVMELHQEALLMRNASRPSVVTWSEGTLSTGDIQKFQDRIRLLVRMFIQDFQSMNESGSPSKSPSWRPSGI